MFEYNNNTLYPSLDQPLKTLRHLPLPYVGNKKKLSYVIYDILLKHDLDFNCVLDAFSGSASMAYLFKAMGKKVIANDILQYAHANAVTLVVNEKTKLTSEQKEYLLHNTNPNNTHFVENNYSGKKFTLKECQFLDNFRANVTTMPAEAAFLALCSIATVCLRLPFGNIDMSLDLMNHRRKQQKAYGPGSDHHDRRIGIYYDEDLNLKFDKWFLKYCNDFESATFSGPKCTAIQMDAVKAIREYGSSVDCLYYDAPYGGVSSDYGYMYRFLEEYISQKRLEELDYCLDIQKFVSPEIYENNFIELLKAAKNIPLWVMSFNDKSWKKIEEIVDIVSQFKTNVKVEMISDSYCYKYRKQCGDKKKREEYLIIANRSV